MTTSWTDLNATEKNFNSLNTADSKLLFKIESLNQEKKWISDVNNLVIDFGQTFHSAYLRWAVTINGLHVAQERYSSPKWQQNGQFSVQGIRNSSSGKPEYHNIQIWDGNVASDVHSSAIPMLAGWGFCHLYSCLEEFVFKIFRIYLDANPQSLMRDSEFKHLRKAYKERETSLDKERIWNELWQKRLESWHKKKIYSGLHNVFKNFIKESGLQVSILKNYNQPLNYDDIAQTIYCISTIRNCFIHGVKRVSQELSDICQSWQSSLFKFEYDKPFEITNHELMIFEYFMFHFVEILNLSCVELSTPDMKEIHMNFIKNDFSKTNS